MSLEIMSFKDINLNDPFFDSLKMDYKEFSDWFAKKAEEWAYVFFNNVGQLEGFLYLKDEQEMVTDVTPRLPAARRIKIGTMKINPHGTRLGERFVKKIFDHALHSKAQEIYVTVFPNHAALIALYERYGFQHIADKITPNGTELVLVRKLEDVYRGVLPSYPFIRVGHNKSALLSIYPQWHTRLFPDSILNNESSEIIQDISHTNSIHKVYLTDMTGVDYLNPGDNLLIYRTSDKQGTAFYRSVATSLCVVEEYRSLDSFKSKTDFYNYCRPYSVFNDKELRDFWEKKIFRHIIRFTYNIALRRRVTRGEMIEQVGLDKNGYWGFMPLSTQQFIGISRRGEIDENLIIYQT